MHISKKDPNIICIVENIEDLWVIEKANIFNGKYHILGGTLSAVKGMGPDNLNIASLQKAPQTKFRDYSCFKQ